MKSVKSVIFPLSLCAPPLSPMLLLLFINKAHTRGMLAYGATITTVDELAEAPAPAHVGG